MVRFIGYSFANALFMKHAYASSDRLNNLPCCLLCLGVLRRLAAETTDGNGCRDRDRADRRPIRRRLLAPRVAHTEGPAEEALRFCGPVLAP